MTTMMMGMSSSGGIVAVARSEGTREVVGHGMRAMVVEGKRGWCWWA